MLFKLNKCSIFTLIIANDLLTADSSCVYMLYWLLTG